MILDENCLKHLQMNISKLSNEKPETAKLLKVVDAQDKQLADAKAFVAKAKKIVEAPRS